jgi:hypothetical protein
MVSPNRPNIAKKPYLFYVVAMENISKKSLMIPKGQSETVYRGRTDKTMAKRKSTKGQTTINKTYTKLKIE